MAEPHLDVLIIGAGISGIGMACHLTRECPGKTYAILERRGAIGGTWDLFRYPGIRSDSDMFTFGFNFRPWTDTKVLADGTSIREYVRDTAAEYGVERHIRFGRKVITANFSTEDSVWTVETRREDSGETEHFTAGFLVAGTGYYNYDSAYRPHFPGEEHFGGQLVHPQFWPEELDYKGKQVVIIGSGATAVTLMPAMAPEAGHVTMLQRSPSYIVSLPAQDKISEVMNRFLPDKIVYKLTRARNVGVQRGMYALARRRPDLMRKIVLKGAVKHLAGTSDLANFTPKYDPWDQRLCVVPDGDLFTSIREGRADIVTDTIETFTETGVKLASGKELAADIVITATGLAVQLLGGATLSVDGAPVAPNQSLTYKGVLLTDVPNAALVFGYINASWTLKADLAAEYVCRLLKHLDEHGYAQVVARATAADLGDGSVFGALNSGYVRRGQDALPRQGAHGPWRVSHNYLHDAPMLRRKPIDDGILHFAKDPAVRATEAPRATA